MREAEFHQDFPRAMCVCFGWEMVNGNAVLPSTRMQTDGSLYLPARSPLPTGKVFRASGHGRRSNPVPLTITVARHLALSPHRIFNL